MAEPGGARVASRALWALLALAACGGGGGTGLPDGGADAFIGPARALFEVPRPQKPPADGFYAMPYPTDVRVNDTDGHIDLSDHVRPNDLLGEYIDAIMAGQRGFSLNAGIFFRFDEPIDEATLPATPEDSVATDASVYLVNVDPASPDYGMRTPLRFRFEEYAGESIGGDWLCALPFPGFALREQTTYAVVVTTRVHATDGTPVGTAADFDAIAGDTTPTDPALERAQAIYQPLWDWLDEPGGDERADVASATIFTTQGVVGLIGAIREVVRNQVPPPDPRDITWLREQDGYVWYDGIYDGPNFQAGTVPYMKSGGQIEVNDNGVPIVQRMEQLRFSFTVPSAPMPAGGWPVVLYAHGTGGDYHSFRGRSKALAEQGLAVIGVDQVLHGPRNPGASPEISFFNLQNPQAARYNTLQGALDNFQLVRLVQDLDYTERHPGGRTIRFDPTRIYFFGHSQGGLTGPPFLAVEPLVSGAVLSGAGGLIYLSLLLKTEPVNIAGIIGAFVRDYPLDEFNNFLALIQGWIDLSDPVNYAPYLVRDPLPAVGAKYIYESEGFTDRFAPPLTIEALATAIGGSQVDPIIRTIPGLALRGRDVLQAPVTGNIDGITAVLLQYNEAAGSDGHFVVFDVPAAQAQSIQFLGTLAKDGAATLVKAP